MADPSILLRKLTRRTTAQRNAAQAENYAKRLILYNNGTLSEPPVMKKRKRSFLTKTSPTHWDASKPGVGAELLSFWLDKNETWRLKEMFAPLGNFADVSFFADSLYPKLKYVGNDVLRGRRKG
jgi:hypothetical protein